MQHSNTEAVSIRVELAPALSEQLSALWALLEHAPDFVRQCLLDRLPGLLSSVANLDLPFATVAGDGVFLAQLSPAGEQELRAATACAAQRGLCCVHGCPFRKVV